MAKKMLIDATHAEETRVVVVDGNKVEEFDFESENKRQLAGNIYLAKVTRVEPSLQAAFVDYGGNRHGFLAFSEIHPDYYQIPVADREALMEEERAYAEATKARDEEDEKPRKTRKPRKSRKKVEEPVAAATEEAPVETTEISGMETIDLAPEGDEVEGLSPMELVSETPVEEPAEDAVAEDAVTENVVLSEEAPAEVIVSEDAPPEDAPAEEAPAEEAVAEEAPAVEADDADKKPGQTMAAASKSDDAVATRDPETGEETETDAAPAAEVEAEVVVDAPVEAESAPEAEAAKVDDTAVSSETTEEQAEPAAEEVAEKPKRKRAPRRRKPKKDDEAKVEEQAAPAAEDDAAKATPADDDDADEEETPRRSKATEKDDSIESVADDDDTDDIRPPRKPRPRRYKIQEVVKVRQIMLVQVVKEERGNKGAALTTYLSLAGRYCVLMPNTARGGGISRKITNAVDRKKLKEIANEIDVPQGAGLIVRTAGAKRTKAEIKRDYEYLQRMWEQIRALTLKSIAPAKIYEEGDLIKRSIRDLYSREIDEVLVEGERGYRIAKDFMKMIMPSHAKNVKNYHDQLPLFARYQVETYLGGMFNPTVQLKSGGYIVIGVTEALVAIDVNSGRATKEGSIEDTATKTNLEAAEEVARQLRLRDLAGLIVIDFIDMDERKNNLAVEKRMKDKLKTDRARIQVGRISGFGLMEMSRQRLRPGMIEATTQPCPHCHGTGLIRSDDNLALSILRQIEEEGTRGRSREVLVRAPVAISNYLMNQKREHIAQIEARYGLSVRVEGDPMLVSPDFSLEKFKTATRAVPEATPVVSVNASLMEQIDEDTADTADIEDAEIVEASPIETTTPDSEGDDKPRKKRRRRRRRRKSSDEESTDQSQESSANTPSEEATTPVSDEVTTDGEEAASEGEKPKKKTRSRTRRKKDVSEETAPQQETSEGEVASTQTASTESVTAAETAPVAQAEPADVVVEDTPTSPVVTEVIVEEAVAEPAPEPEMAVAEAVVAPTATEPEAPAEPPKPKRRGWWSRG